MTDTAPLHGHVFLGEDHELNERRTWAVIALTGGTMVVEIVAGTMLGSMALLADGWHMATHAAAILVAALAYRFARRHAADARFTFGTGKVGDLAGFSSAVLLALIALLIGWESLARLVSPTPVQYGEALVVAVAGLAVNLVSALLLGGHAHVPGMGHDHGPAHHHAHHDHDHDHQHHDDHDHHDHGHDHHRHGHGAEADSNLRGAYLHVLADALTSVLAIFALSVGWWVGVAWLDPAVGLFGAAVIMVWAAGLVRQAGAVLLDLRPPDCATTRAIRAAVEVDGDRLRDLHVWQLGPGHMGAILSVASADPQPVAHYRARLAGIDRLSHVTIEVDRA